MHLDLTRRDLMKFAAGALATGTVFPPSTRQMSTAFAQTANPTGTYYWVAHVGPGDPYWAVVQRGVQAVGKALGVKAVRYRHLNILGCTPSWSVKVPMVCGPASRETVTVTVIVLPDTVPT